MRRLALILVACLLLPASSAWAITPMEYTRATLERATAIMSSGATHNQKLAELSALFNNFLDTDAMARQALGAHWPSLNPSQRKEFLALFHVMMERTYVQKLMLFENPKFSYVGETRSDGVARVDTRIITPGDEVSVVYQLRHEGERWMVTSITVEKVNLTANYATQLNRLLTHSSVDDVLAVMRRKYGSHVETTK